MNPVTLAPDTDVTALRELAGEIRHLDHAATLLSWDQETMMPRGGVAGRAGSLAFLRTEIHRRWASDELAGLIDRLDGRLEPGCLDEALLGLCRREHALAIKLTPELIAARSRASTEARPLWRQAGAESDWSVFAPAMKRVLEVCIETAETIGYANERFDAMLELYEPGVTTARLETLLFGMRETAVPLLRELESLAASDGEVFGDDPWDPASQLAFARFLTEAVGFDHGSGRIDLSAHPIANGVGLGDVRITTHLDGRWPMRGLFGAMHEVGHGLYAQAVPAAFEQTPLWGAASIALDESQSRLWENAIGRSRPFWQRFLPDLRRHFPGRLEGVSLDAFYTEINRPSLSAIRLDADELTYNLHVLVRFEIERDLLEQRLQVDDVPEAWAEGMKRHLGINVASDAEGPLQDIHWAGCYLGTFTSYTLGDLIAAQLMAEVREAVPDLDAHIAVGDFTSLLAWLADNVHRHGASFTCDEIVSRATGAELSVEPWSAAMRERFTPLAA